MAWAEQQYHQCLLQAPEADAARRYLDERGITAESIEKFHLGFSPLERDWILRSVRERGSGEASQRRAKILETIGILSPADRGRKPFDRFRGRVAILDPRRPRPAGGHRRPRAAGTGHDQPREVRQFARNAAFHQEQVALRARSGPRVAAERPARRWSWKATPT